MLTPLVLLALALAVLWFVAAPLLREDAAESERVVSARSEAVELQSRHAMALESRSRSRMSPSRNGPHRTKERCPADTLS